jgi:hypothetical protein
VVSSNDIFLSDFCRLGSIGGFPSFYGKSICVGFFFDLGLDWKDRDEACDTKLDSKDFLFKLCFEPLRDTGFSGSKSAIIIVSLKGFIIILLLVCLTKKFLDESLLMSGLDFGKSNNIFK